MKYFKLAAGAALMTLSGAALADGFRGNVGAVSEYLFRGVEGSEGAAIQGELYYAWDQGFYAGAWITNARASSNKVDAYAGYEGRFGEFTLGGGGVFRYYSEDLEAGTVNPLGEEIDFPELFITGALGPASLTAYFTNDYFGTGLDASYITGDVTLPYSETVSFVAQAGLNSGDGVKLMRGEEFTDYSLTLEKRLEGGMSASFQLSDTDRKFASGLADDPKFVVGFRKDFTL